MLQKQKIKLLNNLIENKIEWQLTIDIKMNSVDQVNETNFCIYIKNQD